MQKDSFTKFALATMGSLLTAYLYWASKAIVDIQSKIAVLNYAVFKTTVAKSEPVKKETIESGGNIFKFLLKEIPNGAPKQ